VRKERNLVRIPGLGNNHSGMKEIGETGLTRSGFRMEDDQESR
jgi:hypothetical protein